MTATIYPTAGAHGGAERARPELLDVHGVAALMNCAPRTVYRLDDAGRMPRRIKLGALVRWRRGEIMAWIEDGCPQVRDTFMEVEDG